MEKGAIYNIGDNMQTFAVDHFYRRMGIPQEEIIDINASEMKNYDGEEVVLPIAGYVSHYKRCNQLPASGKIIPLFISFEMSDPTCDDIIPYLKKYEPIGCRDEATMLLLGEKGVDAYISGCLTIALPRRVREPACPKTFFVDISSKLEEYIPDRLRENCEYVRHEGQLKQVPMTESERKEIDAMAMEVLERYRKEAGLVVTSRLRAAASCIALGIPVVLAIDNIDRRFSWLDKLVPIYDAGHYDEIDWNPAPCDCEDIKEKLFHIFKSNITALCSRTDMYAVSDYWKERVKADYDGRLWKKLSGLRERFASDDTFVYLIWGAGVHGKLAYSMMKEHFPNAKMAVCVDKYVEGAFFDGNICKPKEISHYKFDYALITSHPGRFEAVQVLNELGMEWNRDFCYFISKDVPEERYAITKDDEIVLYGNNAYCKEQVEQLAKEGYRINGIIDRNSEYGGHNGIPIFRSVEEIHVSDKTCVFIMLQNGMLHWDIAFYMYQHGINRVVFLPMIAGFYSRKVQSEFITQYNYMMEKKYALMRVPYLHDEMFEKTDRRLWFEGKKLESGDFIIWMAVDLVKTTVHEYEKYRDIPIVAFDPYINLFKLLKGESADISEYIRIYGKAPFPETSREAYVYVFNKRRDLYGFFEEQFNSGNMEYFMAAAPMAEWNEKGYVNLCEGQHRCVYLLSKGMKYVPIRVGQDVLNMTAINTVLTRQGEEDGIES